MEENLYSELLLELECPVCTDYMKPPIQQCVTGHSICESCRKKLPKCPLCQGIFTISKNISLEGLARKMQYPCINRSSGCTAKLKLEDREAHEIKCKYKGFKCGMDRCPWVGQLEDILAHWESKKITGKPYHAKNVCHTKIKAETNFVNIVKAHNELFWFRCKIGMGKVFWAVQYIGDSKQADKYYYEIEIVKPALPKCSLKFSQYCQTVDLEGSELFEPGSCSLISLDCVEDFIGSDQLLIYFLFVHKVSDDNRGMSRREMKHQKHRDRSLGRLQHDKQRQFRKKT